jgi:peptidoglycan-associated lipoprotein
MRSRSLATLVLVPMLCVTFGCASKKLVRTEVGNVNAKVDSLTEAIEDTQERTRQNEVRIGAVDTKAEAAARSASDARAAAEAASARASAVGTAVNARIDQVVAASRQLSYEVTLSEDQGNFTFGGANLPDEAKARLDDIIGKIKSDSRSVFIEIEGHTDNVGSNVLNERLGLERAETVKRYLYEQHQLPLHRISVISYGEARPVAPNNSREGRAQNRRVVVRVRDQPTAK